MRNSMTANNSRLLQPLFNYFCFYTFKIVILSALLTIDCFGQIQAEKVKALKTWLQMSFR